MNVKSVRFVGNSGWENSSIGGVAKIQRIFDGVV